MANCIYCTAETELFEAEKPVCTECLARGREQLKRNNQAALVDFLSTDMELAFALLDSSKAAAQQKHMDHARSALDKAREALAAIRRLSGHVQDPLALERIQERANRLEQAIESTATPAGEPIVNNRSDPGRNG